MKIDRVGKVLRQLALLLVLLGFVLAMAACEGADQERQPVERIALPSGFRPEGVAIAGNALFVGSIPSGRVFRADLATGEGAVLVDPAPGRSAIGLKVDGRDRLFVAGGATGQAYVYDVASGAELAVYALATGTTFINDVIVTPEAAWFTDSRNPVLYRLPIDPASGALGGQGAVSSLPLSGAFLFVAEQNNANGIAATPDGTTLIIVQSSTGKLFTVNPASGVAGEIDLGGEIMTNGDGLLLEGRTLYVVQNRLNQVAKIALAADLASGTVLGRVSDPDFDVPTTVAASDGSLYLPNARFGIADPDLAEYAVVRIDKP